MINCTFQLLTNHITGCQLNQLPADLFLRISQSITHICANFQVEHHLIYNYTLEYSI